jgi:hypothetical protein
MMYVPEKHYLCGLMKAGFPKWFYNFVLPAYLLQINYFSIQ